MAYVREETLDKFTDEQLLQMVKESLDELGITYEEGPGGFGDFLPLDPADFDNEENEESYTIQVRPTDSSRYCAQAPMDYHFDVTVRRGGRFLVAMLGHQPEDDPVLVAA